VQNEVIEARLNQLLSPVVYNQLGLYRQLGHRARILTLPLMMAVVLTLIWRQVPSVEELTRVLEREDLLWAKATRVTQKALSKRLLHLKAVLFKQVFQDLLEPMAERWQQRQNRPLPPSVRYAQQSFAAIWIADGSTLEALFRKLKSLEDAPVGQLGGKMMVVLDLVRRLPVEVWVESAPYAHDTTFTDRLLSMIQAPTLLILDRGFWDFRFFAAILETHSAFITRLKAGAAIEVLECLSQSPWHRDSRIRLGKGYQGNPILTLRLVEVRVGSQWYRYLTSVLDPTVLPPGMVADLYARRWRIEDTFHTVKRLLGLSYLWTGAFNGIALQVWATWIVYIVLADLADELADELALPVERISLEMLYRGLYHFSVAYDKGRATDPIAYFADPQNQDLDVVKSLRKKRPQLEFTPFPKTLTAESFP
jgi:hypothetical protein